MSDNDVEIIHRKNRLKEKVSVGGVSSGKGFIDPQHIKNAQKVIEDGGDAYQKEIEKTLHRLLATWAELQKMTSQDSGYKEKLDEIHRYTNHIKDIASTFSYNLMDYFAQSLRDFSDFIDVGLAAHVKIVQAHIDVMMVAFQKNIKDDGGVQAQELKKIVAQAITKYSQSEKA